MTSRWESFWFRELPAWRLGAFRVLLGATTVCFGLTWLRARTLQHLATGFHSPAFAWIPPLPETLATPLLVATLAGAVLLMVGERARLWSGLLAAIFFYVLWVEDTYYENNLYFHATLLLLLTIVGGGPSLRELLRGGAGSVTRPAWREHLIRMQLAIVFFYAALDKVVARDWGLGGAMLARLSQRSPELLEPVVSWIGSVPALASTLPGIASVGTIGLELAIAFGCLVPRLWPATACMGLGFAAFVELSLRPRFFGWDVAAAMLLFLPVADRAYTWVGGPRGLAALDWSRRLRFEPGPALRLEDGCHVYPGVWAFVRVVPLLAGPVLLALLGLARVLHQSGLGMAVASLFLAVAGLAGLVVAGLCRARRRPAGHSRRRATG